MKHEIEIQDLPEGWEAVAYRMPIQNKDYVFVSNQVILCVWPTRSKHIIASKKQPRRIVLEETGEDAGIDWNHSIHFDDIIIQIDSAKLWKILEE